MKNINGFKEQQQKYLPEKRIVTRQREKGWSHNNRSTFCANRAFGKKSLGNTLIKCSLLILINTLTEWENQSNIVHNVQKMTTSYIKLGKQMHYCRKFATTFCTEGKTKNGLKGLYRYFQLLPSQQSRPTIVPCAQAAS